MKGDRRFVLAVLASVVVAALGTPRGVAQDASVDPALTNQPREANLVLRGGLVSIGDGTSPDATAVAIVGDRIAAVGDDASIGDWVGSATQVIELGGRRVVPGFIEGHGHYLALGESRMMLDLTTARTWPEIVAQVAAAAQTTPPGEWIIGRGWHQEKWETPPEPQFEGYPTAEALDRAAPNHPVLLEHASGHMSIANGYAMREASIDAATTNPPGGEILHDAAGQPTGVLRETAQSLVERVLAADQQRMSAGARAARQLQAIELAGRECLANGITSFQDAGTSFLDIDVLADLDRQGKLQVRLWVMIRDNPELLAERLPAYRHVAPDGFLTVRAIKLSIDGALGSHGAWLLLPYNDLPTSEGLNTIPLDVVRRVAELAAEHQFAAHPTDASRRWRIEHAQHLDPQDIPRFGQLGVIASMQGVHCTSDAVFVIERLGYRRAAQGAYVWRSLLDTGAIVTNGTDTPVERVNPIASFYASVTRRLPSGVEFFPEQKLTRAEALRSYTLDCAYAAFEEEVKGSLTVGKLADLVVLSHDIMTCPEDEILSAQVDYTVLGGRVVYDRAALR